MTLNGKIRRKEITEFTFMIVALTMAVKIPLQIESCDKATGSLVFLSLPLEKV